MNRNQDDWMVQEIPTHVDQKDKVFLGMTFFQIVILIMVSAMAYVLFQSALLSSLGIVVRYSVAVVCWLIGIGGVMIEVRGRNIVSLLWDIFSHIMSTTRYSGLLRTYLDAPPKNPDIGKGGYQTPLSRLLSVFEKKVVKDG